MNTIILISCYIIWILYFLIEGYREAYYFNYASQFEMKKDLHKIFTFQRILIIILINMLCYFLLYKLIIFNIALICIQPFIHNGMYYTIRHKLNNLIYNKKWFDMSSTSTAFLTKFETPLARLIFAFISLILFILLLL